MTRRIRIATTSLATLEDVAPPYNLRHPSRQENLERGLSLLEAAGATGADLACLPEAFTGAGRALAAETEIEPLDGPTLAALAGAARRHSMHVVAGLYVAAADGSTENVAVVLDRSGALLGTYAKRFPTPGEIEAGVCPGGEARVVETELGRIGLAICFDLNWPAHWTELKQQGAELVCWLSAYEGGLPLQAYAWLHRYPIVTSVWPYHARVIDITGRASASTSRWSRVAVADVDLDRRLLHTDGQSHKILDLQRHYGARLGIETFTEEHWFTLESADPDLDLDDVVRDFELLEYDDYIRQCDAEQQARLGGALAARGG